MCVCNVPDVIPRENELRHGIYLIDNRRVPKRDEEAPHEEISWALIYPENAKATVTCCTPYGSQTSLTISSESRLASLAGRIFTLSLHCCCGVVASHKTETSESNCISAVNKDLYIR